MTNKEETQLRNLVRFCLKNVPGRRRTDRLCDIAKDIIDGEATREDAEFLERLADDLEDIRNQLHRA